MVILYGAPLWWINMVNLMVNLYAESLWWIFMVNYYCESLWWVFMVNHYIVSLSWTLECASCRHEVYSLIYLVIHTEYLLHCFVISILLLSPEFLWMPIHFYKIVVGISLFNGVTTVDVTSSSLLGIMAELYPTSYHINSHLLNKQQLMWLPFCTFTDSGRELTSVKSNQPAWFPRPAPMAT